MIAKQFALNFQKIALPRHSLPELILLSICAGFVIFPIVQSTALRFVPFLPSFSAIFYGADDVHSGQKDFFQCIELRDLVDVQTKRDYPGDERVIKTQYRSELTIFLFVAFLPFYCNFSWKLVKSEGCFRLITKYDLLILAIRTSTSRRYSSGKYLSLSTRSKAALNKRVTPHF